ncbi:MAG: CPBP family intramembrane metalloprotease [candidate division Zixibacteria bacterium]|nr:CPBP family intramembrane metalloprotease [Candidatus Tariuqbacter arcticus]
MLIFTPRNNGNPLAKGSTLPPEPMLFIIVIATFIFIFLFAGPIFKVVGKLSYIITESLILAPVMIYLIREKFRWKTVLRLKSIPKPLFFISFLIGISMAVVLDEVDRLIGLMYSMPSEISEAIAESLIIENLGEFLILGIGVIIVTSFSEEILFRGFFQRSLEHHRGVTQAVTTTSIVFALVHFNYWWIIQILILSMVLGVLAWRAESILPSVIVHAVHNGLGLWSANADVGALSFYSWKGHVSPLILISAILLLIWSMKRFYILTVHLHREYEEKTGIDSEIYNERHK